ncbi:MAG: C13 family peptidase [Muribaculaceae bacterium]|nr:C13 family peptidase [Muribaculaceae bacterium]
MKQKLILLMLLASGAIQCMAQMNSSVPSNDPRITIDPGVTIGPVVPIDPVIKEIPISKKDVLEASKMEFQDMDVDYYIMDGMTCWRVFVDAEPLKGWEHEGYILDYPLTIKRSEILIPLNKTFVCLPPKGNYKPLEINSLYDTNSFTKPVVSKINISQEEKAEAEKTYALIISGGIAPCANKERYWNDCSFIYQTLVNRYGVPRENIYPIMADGANSAPDMLGIDGKYRSQSLDLDGDGIDDISLAATKSNISATLSDLQNKMKKDDHLFVYVISHGGRNYLKSTSNIWLWDYECLEEKELAEMLEPFTDKYVNVNVMLGQSYAGGFIDDLNKVGCVVTAATAENEESWACPDIPYDEFVYHWTCAVNGRNHAGVPVDGVDLYPDGRITMDEAFAYAKRMDRRNEHPMYNSNPVSVGQDLSFNRIPESIDLFIQNNPEDTGREPNLTTKEFWKCPAIWVRNQKDGIEIHENPVFEDEDDEVYVYVKIHNRGKEDYVGGKHLIVYWAEASTAIDHKTWRGRETNQYGDITGYSVNQPKKIGSINAGDSITMYFKWDCPDNLKDRMDGEYHFCLLAKILDYPADEAYIEGVTNYELGMSNDLAQKNVIIIKRRNILNPVNVYVRNTSKNLKSYTLELKPQTVKDAELFTKAKVQLEMSSVIYDAWERGGLQYNDLELSSNNANGVGLRTVKFVSPESRLKSITLRGEEFDIVKVKCNFNDYTSLNDTYTLDLIQRDENGVIVGGETFIIEAPLTGLTPLTIESSPTGDNQQLLEVNSDDFKSFEWSNSNGEIISDAKSITVSPSYGDNEFTVVGVTEDGEVATCSITLDIVNGIKSATTMPQNKQILVELQSNAPKNASVSVNSVLNGSILKNVNVERGVKSFTIDALDLEKGMYVINYIVNTELIDNKKVNIQ